MENTTSYKFLAKFYDLFDLIFLFGGKGNPRFGLLEAISNKPLHILDLCIGTATSSLLVASHHDQNHIMGIDISDEMLVVAQRKIDQKKLSNLELQNMSATAMQLDDNSFDVVMICFALHEFEKALREKVFKETSRVLKPGGLFCVVDFAPQGNSINRAFMKGWAFIEPPCFADFLRIDWRVHLDAYGLSFKSRQEFSFSNLYIFEKKEDEVGDRR
jgi:ubiquinone/menaquinone biosynthesis C-methylase UbiE